MSTALQRGMVLLQQGRYDLADGEFRQELAESPDNAVAHAFLALCLEGLDRVEEALKEADEAIRGMPDLALCHFARGRALHALRRFAEAESSAVEAIRLDPDDADNRALLAATEIGRGRWPRALEAAESGLALDPENLTCANIRAMALVQLGRKDEAARALGSALADDPENALTHANQGWSLLHRGDHAKALEHFREALRLDPELEWARRGTIEALKARFWIYRIMLAFFLWMGRQGFRAQLAVIFGITFGRGALDQLQVANPRFKPFITPILALTFGFLLLTWIASPLFNLLLRFNKFGRLALNREEKAESSWIGSFFVLAAGFFLWNTASGNWISFIGMSYFGLLLLPLAVTFRQESGWPRRIAGAYTAILAAVGVATFVLIVDDRATVQQVILLIQIFCYGAMASTFAPLLFRRQLAH